MNDFEVSDSKDGFSMKLWRGERMCLLAFDVKTPEPDFVGFAIQRKEPGMAGFEPLLNRIAFSYATDPTTAVTGQKKFSSLTAPFQKFRWIHFPEKPQDGVYSYRATKMHMPKDGVLTPGTSLELSLPLHQVTYAGFLDVGFTRNFASSQALLDHVPPGMTADSFGKTIIPANADDGLEFKKTGPAIYQWLGFEAVDFIFRLIDEAVRNENLTLDVFAYDLNEPDVVGQLAKLGKRLRIIVDDSIDEDPKTHKQSGHGLPESAETKAAEKLKAAGAQMKRTHFVHLQHHKVLILKRGNTALKVLHGSTNFSFRGFYIQANNALVFTDESVAGLFAEVFQACFTDPANFKKSPLASQWHVFPATATRPKVEFCFSPHKNSEISLNRVGDAIAGAQSSVIYAVAFLNQIKSGQGRTALDKVLSRDIFSHGTSDKAGGMELQKPDGSTGLVQFEALAENSPEPFKSEWRGGGGINIHHKFVVTDFNLPTAKLFTGSCNLSPSGETGNGDNFVLIEDQKVATSFAIEGMRIFDHLLFRDKLSEAKKAHASGDPKKAREKLTLRKPTAISGQPAWFEKFYHPGSQLEKDRVLFSH